MTRTNAGWHLALEGGEGAIVFDAIEPRFTYARSDQPFTRWNSKNEGWLSVLDTALPAPGVDRLQMPLVEKRGADTYIHYDIIGLAYWMLARVEEIGREDLDRFHRFKAKSSHAFEHGYLDRPVVDEWLDLLGQVIRRQWSQIELKQHKFQIQVSHDVDQPSLYAFQPWKTILRMMARHLLKSRDPKAFLTAPYVKILTRNRLMTNDPYNTFNFLMDVSEQNSLMSEFFFICGRTCPQNDPNYKIDHPAIKSLLRNICDRGHKIGLHPSYETINRADLISQELSKLKKTCEKEGIYQQTWGARMHYLRWSQPSTMRALADAGLNYDSTLSYADCAGFRCGTCFEYPGFDAVASEMLKIRIQPLVVMDNSILDDVYMGLGDKKEGEEELNKLRDRCRQLKGVFSILWHNSSLKTSDLLKLYKKILKNTNNDN